MDLGKRCRNITLKHKALTVIYVDAVRRGYYEISDDDALTSTPAAANQDSGCFNLIRGRFAHCDFSNTSACSWQSSLAQVPDSGRTLLQ